MTIYDYMITIVLILFLYRKHLKNQKELKELQKHKSYICNKCKDTGKILFKTIEYSMYSWQPWETRTCDCKNTKKL